MQSLVSSSFKLWLCFRQGKPSYSRIAQKCVQSRKKTCHFREVFVNHTIHMCADPYYICLAGLIHLHLSIGRCFYPKRNFKSEFEFGT